MRFVLLALAVIAAIAAQPPSAPGGASSLDFEFFKTRVQPVFLAKRAGHARCYACHSAGTPFRLQRLSPGATSWNDDQSRKNFQASSNMINLSDVEASPLLTYPLAESAGGNHFHPGGKHWDSKSAPEWQALDEWAHGRKATPSRSSGPASGAQQGAGSIVRLDPAFDQIVPKDAVIEKLAGGFQFTEGPLWRSRDQVLWFSDVVGNVVRQWSPTGEVRVLIQKAGGDPGNVPRGFVGPNGEVAGKDGDVLICQHTGRRIVRVGKDLKMTPLVERYQGKRFNSPNDLVYRSDGALYFTDPPYGLPKQDDDPAKEIAFNGVYRLKNGKVDAIIKDLTRPNGIAFSPDQKVLYIANSDEKRKVWMRYEVAEDGTAGSGRVFFDVTAEKEDGLPDGMKIDSQGNVYGAGPGGVWVFSPDGRHLGTIKPTETPANCNWGDDGKSLYITARTGLYRIKLAVSGQKPAF